MRLTYREPGRYISSNFYFYNSKDCIIKRCHLRDIIKAEKYVLFINLRETKPFWQLNRRTTSIFPVKKQNPHMDGFAGCDSAIEVVIHNRTCCSMTMSRINTFFFLLIWDKKDTWVRGFKRGVKRENVGVIMKNIMGYWSLRKEACENEIRCCKNGRNYLDS